jgi:hypothetical protein
MFEGFFHHERKMGALGAVTVIVLSLIFMFFERSGKHLFGLINLHPDLGQVGKLERGTVLFHVLHQVKAIEGEVSVLRVKSFLREIERLLDEVRIRVAAHGSQNLGLWVN